MFGLFIAIFGLLLIATTLYMILREFRREARVESNPDASFYETLQNMDDEIERLREEMDGINESFYQVVEDLNDRVNDLKRQLQIHTVSHSSEPHKEDAEPPVHLNKTIDITQEIRKSDVYHTYEMADKPTPNKEPVKEVQVFPEQRERRRIIQMHHAGKSIYEIAKEVNKGTGEVQLILNLLGKK